MALNPDILTWARTTAGLSVGEAAQRLGFRDARERPATERLMALETGAEEPSRSVLLKMAKAYRRSLLVFYLEEPPRTGDRGQDFRTVPGVQASPYDPVLDALIRDVRGRQAIVKSVLEDSEPQRLAFVGSASMADPVGALANRIIPTMQFSLVDFRRRASVDLAFNYLREKIEAAGIFVLLLGNLGSHHTNIPVETFRGFAIADPIAPFVVVNDQDARAAWSFTALHEVVHLWLGTTGVSGASTEVRIERYCNDVAGELLLPAAEIGQLAHLRRASLEDAIQAVSEFARFRRISRAMVAYKLLQTNVINEAQWRDLSDRFRREWLATRARQEDEPRNAGGPSYYVIKRHRLGGALLDLVRHSLGDGILSYTKAGQVLGVKPRNVDPLLHGSPLPVGR
jgi:Zn-dependent peptidase ImmA (M78 family)/transcriptional regulator with XRE-family HTH domain